MSSSFSCFFLFLLPFIVLAQPSVELEQASIDLKHDGVLMSVSAHPDDEDGATLAYYRMKYGVKTFSIFLTRGEGGQNEKGPELYEDLGVLRTAETQAAGSIQGVDVYFLNFMDFGYSKSATEAFQKWGRREVVRRLVYMIRKLKPDVISSNLNTIDGHGHHQAAAVATIAAFDAAADPAFAPEQLKQPGISLWQPKKLFFRNVNRPDIGFTDWGHYDVVNSIEEVNKARGISYLDIATQALRMHKTQGMDRIDLRRFGRILSLYKLIRASSLFERDSTSFFGGIDYWDDPSLKDLLPIRTGLLPLTPGMPQDSLLRVASFLLNQVELLRQRQGISPLASRMLSHWDEELQRLVRLSCGVSVGLTLADPVVVPGQSVNCTLTISSPTCRVEDVKSEVSVPAGWSINEAPGTAPVLERNTYARDFTVVIGEEPVLTLPKAAAQYRPIETDQEVGATVRCTVNGYPFSFSTLADFEVAPPQTFSVVPKVTRISPSALPTAKSFEYAIKNYKPGESAGRVTVQGPPGWTADFATYRIKNEDSSTTGTITVHPAKDPKPGEYVLKFKTGYAAQEATVRAFDVGVAKGLNVGIVESYDNTLEDAVLETGVSIDHIDAKELESGNLSRHETILIDIRAYLVRADLTKYNARLLKYVKDGGNLVVMYQRPQEWKPEYAPYPFQISSKRITDEDAPVQILAGQHPLLNLPNRISDEDWAGWKQERGIYFPTNVPQEYVRLLSSHDPDEPPLATGYIVVLYGKGSYIYTSYVWYRQLKEMNPGAFRCFANMISYPAYRE